MVDAARARGIRTQFFSSRALYAAAAGVDLLRVISTSTPWSVVDAARKQD